MPEPTEPEPPPARVLNLRHSPVRSLAPRRIRPARPDLPEPPSPVEVPDTQPIPGMPPAGDPHAPTGKGVSGKARLA